MVGSYSLRLLAIVEVAWATFLGHWRTLRILGLGVLAVLPALFEAALWTYHPGGLEMVTAYEDLTILFLPLVILLVTLLLAVPLLRDEMDEESISYLLTRTLGRPRIVVGKYLGFLASASAVLFPTTVLDFGICWAAAGSSEKLLSGVLPSVVAMVGLGILAYGAIYLFIGLITQRALIGGLVYAFVWEFFLGHLSGSAPDLSILHYLVTIPVYWTVAGEPLSSSSTSLTLAQAVEVPILVAAVMLVLGMFLFQHLDASPGGE